MKQHSFFKTHTTELLISFCLVWLVILMLNNGCNNGAAIQSRVRYVPQENNYNATYTQSEYLAELYFLDEDSNDLFTTK